MLNELDKESKATRIQNWDLLYPFALILFMMFFRDLAIDLTILIFLTFNAPILEILMGIFPKIDSTSMDIIITIILNLIAQMGSIVIFVFLYNNKKVEPEDKSMPSDSHLITLLLIYSILSAFSFGLAILAMFFEELGISLKSPYEAFVPTLDLLGEPLFYVLFFSFYTLGASISEELIFRRTFIPVLERRGLGTLWVLLISSLLFSLMHSPQDLLFGSIGFTIVHFFGTFAGGMALGFLYMRTRNIIWPIFLHGLNNGVAAVGQIGYARSNQLGDPTLLSIYISFLLIVAMVGTAFVVYFIIQTIRSKGSPSPPAWFRILTDVNIRSTRLQPILWISLGFIGVMSGFPILFNIIGDFLGSEMVFFSYILETGTVILLLGILAVFIFTKAKPLKEPDWVSEITFPERIPGYSQTYSTPTTEPRKLCGSCGREIPSSTNFCIYCGERVVKVCVSCGQEIVPNSEYCVFCGVKI